MRCFVLGAAVFFYAAVAIGSTGIVIEGTGEDEKLNSMAGVKIFHIRDDARGVFDGYFLDYKSSPEKSPYYEFLNLSSFGDPVVDTHREGSLFNVGVIKKLHSYFSGYIGLGYFSAKGKARKFDPTSILSSNGFYYVDYPDADTSGGNVTLGLLFLWKHLSINVGLDSATEVRHAGIGVVF